MKLTTYKFDLKLKHTFRISREARDIQPTMIVALEKDGFTGYGEATSSIYYDITVEFMRDKLEEIKDIIESSVFVDPKEFWQKMSEYLSDYPFIQNALDQAYHDLWGKINGKPVYQLWGLEAKDMPLTNYTIGIATIDKMVEKMKEMPWPIYKIKLGTNNDVELIRELRKHTDARFRVDANCGWTAEETIANAIELKKLGVDFIEQPLAADNWDGMKKVYSESVLPIIADESCRVEADVKKCAGYFNGVNIKLTKCGGLTPARRMIAEAKSLGLKTMVGCMTESSVGISAIAHLLPLLDYVDMDGALLLSNDIAKGVTIKDGVTTYSNLNGTGVELI